jgi:cellulose synthase/poly-beta-1,6-N-acetylglucosamine synthase-like glycosyltransferase
MNMSDLPSVLLLLVFLPLLIVDLFFALEIAVGLLRGRSTSTRELTADVVIVLPAHNEAAVIAGTLAKLREALSRGMRMLVVADNCSDDTAALARSAGAEVIERTDAERRGKGFALAFARDSLAAHPPKSIIVLDADCRTDRDSLLNLARASQSVGRAVQAVNLLSADAAAGPMVQISTFAFLIKNLVRQRGLQRLAGRVHLTGTGMCLPWPVFAQADLATASIVEDLRLGLELAQNGVPPRLAEDAFVWSPHASADQTLGQRSRWEGGFLATMRTTAPGMLASGLRSGSLGTILAGLDLMVPPLALMAMINLAALAIAISCGWVGITSWAPALALLVAGSIAAVFLLLAWWREGRSVLSVGALLRIPLYAAWKLPMYAGLVRKGAPAEWNRTARSQETNREVSSPTGSHHTLEQ